MKTIIIVIAAMALLYLLLAALLGLLLAWLMYLPDKKEREPRKRKSFAEQLKK